MYHLDGSPERVPWSPFRGKVGGERRATFGMAMPPDLPHDRQRRSQWKWVSVIVILALLGLVLVLNVSGWDVRPFGSTFKSQQPANPPSSAPTK